LTHFDELITILKDAPQIFIQTHNSPDPDAIASAFGLQYLLKTKGIKSDICFKGEIEKYNTRKMIELLQIEILHINNVNDMDPEDYIILVDSQKGNSNITDFIGKEVAAIDHHPVFVENEYKFADIRPEIGSCSAIIASYYVENNIPLSQNAATALLYGIKMDTLDLTRGVSELDIDMFHYLFKKADIESLNKIQLNTLQLGDLFAYSNAIRNIRIQGSIAFANLGPNCHEALLGTICDFILAIAEVEFAIAYSERTNGIKFSVRSELNTLDAGKIIYTALESIGNGGGHKTMAGGFIPKENLHIVKGPLDSFIENRFLDVVTEILQKENRCK